MSIKIEDAQIIAAVPVDGQPNRSLTQQLLKDLRDSSTTIKGDYVLETTMTEEISTIQPLLFLDASPDYVVSGDNTTVTFTGTALPDDYYDMSIPINGKLGELKFAKVSLVVDGFSDLSSTEFYFEGQGIDPFEDAFLVLDYSADEYWFETSTTHAGTVALPSLSNGDVLSLEYEYISQAETIVTFSINDTIMDSWTVTDIDLSIIDGYNVAIFPGGTAPITNATITLPAVDITNLVEVVVPPADSNNNGFTITGTAGNNLGISENDVIFFNADSSNYRIVKGSDAGNSSELVVLDGYLTKVVKVGNEYTISHVPEVKTKIVTTSREFEPDDMGKLLICVKPGGGGSNSDIILTMSPGLGDGFNCMIKNESQELDDLIVIIETAGPVSIDSISGNYTIESQGRVAITPQGMSGYYDLYGVFSVTDQNGGQNGGPPS